MPHILRAFVWLRWRMFVNSLEQTGSRDLIERFSLAIEKLGPILAAVLMIPSAIGLAGVGAAAGYAMAAGDLTSVVAQLPRFLLIPVPILCIVGPLLLPAADRVNPVRMLLLPIGRGTLYAAQTAAGLGDAWVALTLPLVAAVPAGLAAGGAPGAALLAAAAGLVLVVLLLAVASATTGLIHLVARDRRRGEILALFLLIVLPILGMLPGLLASGSEERGRPGRAPSMDGRLSAAAAAVRSLYPSELYAGAIRAAAQGRAASSIGGVGGLAAGGLLLHAAGFLVFARVMNSPVSSGTRRGTRAGRAREWRVPGLSRGASAVAAAQLRLALRTPRGRAILLSPIALMFVYALLARQDAGGLPSFEWLIDPGVAVACVASFICLISILPLAMNQFAVDTAGLTRVLLLPLDDGDHLAGKAAGNALIAAIPASLALTAAFFIVPGARALHLWAAIPAGLAAVYLLVAPAAAMLSALFPRAADLNSIGRNSNAHGLAGLLGLVAFVAAGGATVAVAAAAAWWVPGRLAPLGAMIAWCALSAVVCRLLFPVARRILAARRDNLAML